MDAEESQRQGTGWARLKPYLYRDSYTIVGYLLFLVAVLLRWRGDVGVHEAIYLLGSRRVADPDFLANDLTWSVLPLTTFLHDHMLAPLWGVLSDFGIANLGRFLMWFLLAWSLSMLARTMRLPPWSVVVGFAAWILAGQTLARCGAPLEGFQPKSFSYPLVFFSLAFVMRGQMIRAGLCAGLATAFHIVIGGWGCLALFLSMLVDRKSFSFRQIGLFLASNAPFIVPAVLAVGLFHVGGASRDELALVDELYVMFAWPSCCDPGYFMTRTGWAQTAAVFLLVPILIDLWPRERASRVLTRFVVSLILFFGLGVLARQLNLLWFLKIHPFQLAFGIPLLFLFIYSLAYFWAERPIRRFNKTVWILGAVVSIGTLDYGDATWNLATTPRLQLRSLRQAEPGKYGARVSAENRSLYAWIRENTPRQAVFITPYVPEFWSYAERAQVASFRQCPQDIRLIEWKARLEGLNGSEPFARRGYDIVDELSENQGNLQIEDLISMRSLYGATYYLTGRRREDLADRLLYASEDYFLYSIADLIATQPTVGETEDGVQ